MELYHYDLPDKLIAQKPVHPRDHARLLVYSLRDGSMTDAYFFDLPKFLMPTTTVVVNNSKVEECRWLFANGSIEIFVLQKLDTYTVRAMVRPGKKFKLSTKLHLTDWLIAEVTAIDNEGIRTLRLNIPHNDPRLAQFEHIPLPPYIAQDDSLKDEYQTVYSKPEGSLAAPTAGLHFTPQLFDHMKQHYPVVEVTLHVGLGTFTKLTEENIKSGSLHEEQYNISPNAANTLNNAKHITAIGTTSLRTLESAIQRGSFKPGSGKTDIFIRPGYHFKAVSSLITNFHLPSTSLMMLVAALLADKKQLDEAAAAHELLRIYKHAIELNYRFYSFGDAMLLV